MTFSTDNNPASRKRKGVPAATTLGTFRAALAHYTAHGMTEADATRTARTVVRFLRTRANGRALTARDFDTIAKGAV